MLAPYQVDALKTLQAGLDKVRVAFGVSKPGEVLNWWVTDDQKVIAMADGFGGSLLKVIQDTDNPMEELVDFSHVFITEADASNAVAYLEATIADNQTSFTEFFQALQRGERPFDD